MSETLKILVKEICEEKGISYEQFSYGYIVRLTKDGKIRHIIGNRMDINPAAADHIACDKAACSLLLEQGGVPAIPHMLVFNPLKRSGWIDNDGTWKLALDYLSEHGRVVVKPNGGWQGRDVFLCDTPAELERALTEIFESEPDACLCPFYDFEYEYRVFYVCGQTQLAYGKKRAPGEWKHNLSGGADAFLIHDEVLLKKLYETAARAAECININFATVDIAALNNGRLKIMEINSSVVAQKLLEKFPEMRNNVKDIYRTAVNKLFL